MYNNKANHNKGMLVALLLILLFKLQPQQSREYTAYLDNLA